MAFSDSLDLDTKHKKSYRVRSWYLYEQFKSLERNQLDAAQKLKDRSYQEKILRKELSERRARRKLYDKFGLCQSDSRIQTSIKGDSTKSSFIMSVGSDDFFETFSEFQDEDQVIHIDERVLSEDGFSQDEYEPDKSCVEDFKSVDDLGENNSYAESVNSVVENTKSNETITCDYDDRETEFTTMVIAEDINKQFDAVKEDIQCLEDLTKQETDDDKISEDCSVCSIAKSGLKRVSVDDTDIRQYENNLIAIWSRLVSFAYQVVQLNRGNCYYDYSSQFLTAVLACDVLRRGVSRMCHILQPYVSPIKFATDESDVSIDNNNKNVKRKKSIQSKKCRKTFEYKLCPNKQKISEKKYSSRNYSDDCWQHYSRRSFKNGTDKRRRWASEPWRSAARISCNRDASASPSNITIWPQFSNDRTPVSSNVCRCCRNKAINPMLKIASYIDSLLDDIDDSKHV